LKKELVKSYERLQSIHLMTWWDRHSYCKRCGADVQLEITNGTDFKVTTTPCLLRRPKVFSVPFQCSGEIVLANDLRPYFWPSRDQEPDPYP